MRGLLELDVPLRLKTGPTVLLHMKACLLTPDINLSSPTLAFGPVQTGKCKVKLSLYPLMLPNTVPLAVLASTVSRHAPFDNDATWLDAASSESACFSSTVRH